MLARQFRLSKEKDFKKIFKFGKFVRAGVFSLKILANNLENNRYGIVISSKVSKKAVERNKLKRQFRAAIRELDGQIVRGFDLIIMVFPSALGKEYRFIKSELKESLSTLKSR